MKKILRLSCRFFASIWMFLAL